MPPRSAEYRRHFPVGVWWTGSTVNAANYDGSSGTTAISPGDATGTNYLLRDPQHGYIPSRLNYAMWGFSVPAVQEDTQAVSDKLDNAVPGPIWHVVTPTGRTGATGTGIHEEYYLADPSEWTEANAETIAAPIVTNYQDHPSLLAYAVEDDMAVTNLNKPWYPAAVTMAQKMQDLDPYGRPAIFTHLFPNNGNLWDDYDCHLALTYRYPCGRHLDNTETAEGDFHRAQNPAIPDFGGGGNDWVDALRQWFQYVPKDAFIWLVLQTHSTIGTSVSTLRQPTDRELRTQFWIAVGEGVKGLWWFRGDLATDSLTVGLFDITRQSALAVVRELSARLTPKIRKILLRCEINKDASGNVVDLFTTSGGGSTGYPVNYGSAYKSTLVHADGRYFVVVCNHSTSTATVTINSATKVGRLRNLENGEEIRVGGTWSLPALDGTIFEYVPDQGVPHKEPDYRQFSVENWWGVDDGGHWANPASSNFVPYGAIQTWPREEVVAPGNLQAAVEAEPSYTTFRLQAGTHPRVSYVFPGQHHFIPDDPLNPPDWHGLDVFGSTYAQQYNNGTATFGLPHHLKVLKTAEAMRAWKNPPRGLLIRGINFVSNGDLVNWEFYQFDNGLWNHDHFWTNAAVGMRLMSDWLIESCTANGYVAGHLTETRTPPFADPAPSAFDTSGTNMSHPGVFWGNGGITGGVIRDTVINGPPGTRAFPHPIFFDGARGCVWEGITLTGKWLGDVLFLTNDDYTFDSGFDGWFDKGMDTREAWCNVAANWDVSKAGIGQTNGGYSIAGGNNLIRNIDITGLSGTLAWVVEVTTKPCQQHSRGLYYLDYGNVIDNVSLSGAGCTTFLRIDPQQGIGSNGAEPTATSAVRSRTGYHTIKNCSAPAVTNWVQDVGTTVAADGGTTQSNNVIG